MPVRLRITLLFLAIVMVIMGVIFSAIYYFSYSGRKRSMRTRLENRAMTTARLLRQLDVEDQSLLKKIDSLTTLTLRHKSVQVYDYQNRKIYSFADDPEATVAVPVKILNDARVRGSVFFSVDEKEGVAYHYTDTRMRMVVVSTAEDTNGRFALEQLLQILIFSFVAGNAVVFAGGYFFSDSLLKPVRAITADVKEISARNFARRIHTGNAHDEWSRLANTLNDLLDRLRDSFELQQRFISNASHEISTPLTSVSNQLEVTLQRPRTAEEYQQVMHSVLEDVQHMARLTQTLLEFAKASGTAGGLELALVRVDEILLDLPAEVSRVSPAYQVKLAFNLLPDDPEHLQVYGNESLLKTAIRNIVVNACKYSADHQALVTLQPAGSQVHIEIADKGMGIPPQELTTIFQPFYRVQEDSANKGFGLGLSLTERIIKLHNGHITVSSRLNEGTVFVIALPAALATV